QWPAAGGTRKAKISTDKSDVLQRGAQAKTDVRVRLDEPPEPMHEPFGGEIGRRGQVEHARLLQLQQAIGARSDAVEGVAHDLEIGAAGFGDDQALSLAVE